MLVFGRKLKELRISRGLTQTELGVMVGVTKVSICCYEKGTRTPTLETLIDLADALGVKIMELLATDYYAVAEDDETKTLNISGSEIEMLRLIRMHPKLYERLLDEPKRTLDYLENKLR